jgi:beta-lactamase regulating signal transducer with metallopeptidase domain
VLTAWAIGVVVGLLRWVFQWNRLLRNLDDRQPIVTGTVHEIFRHLQSRSGASARATLSLAPGIAAPITLGLRRLEICLPPRVTDELQHDEIAALLAHELAHAERSDPQWLVLCRLIEVLCFFQPLNKLCSTWIQDEAEYLCDDWAVVQIGERVPLASCLTEVAGWMVHEPAAQLAPGMAARGTRLSMRVRRLLDEEHEPSAGLRGGWITAFGAASVIAVTLLVPGVAAEAKDPATSALDRRTQDLERLLRDDEHATDRTPCESTPCDQQAPCEPGAPALAEETPAPEPSDAADATAVDPTDLESVLDDLDDQIEEMRRELAFREHDHAFAARLDELANSVARLRQKQRALQSMIDLADEIESTTSHTFPNLFSHKD